MGRARVRRKVPGRISEAEALWYDTGRWPAFVDGFGHLARLGEGWPGEGAELVWDSTPGGRGRVLERVTEHRQRVGQSLAVEDERLRGEQRVTFAAAGADQVEVTLELRYELKQRNPLTPLVDLLFIRRAIADSLGRTLQRFGYELEEQRRADGDI
jgi:hypothetical protein